MKIRRWVTLLVVVALVGVALFITAVHVATSAPDDPALTETRYCGDPKRNLSGEIIRRAAVRDVFCWRTLARPPGCARDDAMAGRLTM